MFCKKCGSKIPEGAKFCKKCGTPTGSVSQDTYNGEKNTHKDQYSSFDEIEKNAVNKKDEDKNNGKKPKKPWWKRILKIIGKIIVVVIILVIIAITVLVVLDYLGIISADDFKKYNEKTPMSVELKGEVLEDNSYRVEPPDADDYFNNNSQIISEVDVYESESIQTGQDAKESFAERGFTENVLTADYSMEGKLESQTEIDENSIEKYPIYQSYYQASSGDIWVVYSINGVIMANPVSYNIQSESGAQVLISESNTVVSYDSTKKKFYETIPNETELIVKTIDSINTETLDSLTIEAIDDL